MSVSFPDSRMSSSRVLAAYFGDIGYEMLKMMRSPAFAVPTLIFPAMFYVMFGFLVGGKGDASVSLSTFARLGVFGTMAPGLFGFGVSLAFEREYGTLVYKQALPLPHGSYLLARMVMAMLFASVISLLLISLALFLVHAPLTAPMIARVFLVEVLGVLPFCALGLMVGSFVSGQAAPAVVNLIYLPMALLSGLWVPLQFLGKTIQTMAPLWPAFHLSQLAHAALGLETLGSTTNHIAALVGVTILCFMIAMRRLGNRGMQLIGKPRASAAPTGFTLGRIVGAASLWIAVGLLVTGFVGGTARVAVAAAPSTSEAATPAAARPDAAATDAGSALPAGVAAPSDPLIADFENGKPDAAYGLGWAALDDKQRGGNSTAAIRVVDGGAAGSKKALEITGTVNSGIAYPFTGTSFLPAGRPNVPFPDQPLADYSGRKKLHFYARGDGRQYMVLLMGKEMRGMPAMYTFTAGPEWAEVNVPIAEMVNLDIKRVRTISIGSMELGEFRFQLDDIEIR